MRITRRGLVTSAVVLGLVACGTKRVQREVIPPDRFQTVNRRAPFLKVHMRDGRLYVLGSWSVDSIQRSVSGTGHLFGPDREPRDSGAFTLGLDSIALLETNVVVKSPNIAAFTAMTVITGAVTLACIANPKACFGSCPTFYAATPDGEHLLAEGFSASVAPALEATDVDALFPARPAGRTLDLHMRNEAWETHVVRHVRVLAAPRLPGGRIFATTDGAFVQATNPVAPRTCYAAEGDCREAVAALDRRERTSRVDSTDLAAREEIELEFPPTDGDLGVVIAYRQTLLTTYLFYQALAWMGDRAGEWMASMARAPAMRSSASPAASALGRIEVLVPGDSGWTLAGRVGETGPLATDAKVVPIPRAADGPVRVRLRLTRGLWRVDQIGLVRLGTGVVPERLRPARVVSTRHTPDELREWTSDSTQALVTLPGDDVDLQFDLPADPDRLELFLEARGYYLEWMRQEWLADAEPARAARMYLDPAGTMRELAPTFSRLEPELERTFWSSRYARP